MTARRVSPAHLKVILPHVQQRDDRSCGPAVLVSVLSYYHADLGGLERARKRLRTTSEGTSSGRLVQLARQCGLRVRAREHWTLAEITEALDYGRPVVVAVRAHGDGHYLAAVGYDRQHVYFMDSCLDGFYGFLTKADFLGRWWDTEPNGRRLERWAMVAWKSSPPYTRKAFPVPW